MRHVVRLGAFLLYFIGSQLGRVEPEVCASERLCPPAGAASPITAANAKVASFPSPMSCTGVRIVVSAATQDEHSLACSAATDAIHLLGRCGISLRKPLHVKIMSEVHHPLGGSVIFGLFDAKQEKVLVTREPNIQPLVDGTPYALLPQRDFTAASSFMRWSME